MTQKIDPVKLKAAAEHLEWVCQQYPDVDKVQGLYKALLPMIEDAKAGRVTRPLPDRQSMPGRWAVSAEGEYREFRDPNVEGAYVDFGIEMCGGLNEEEQQIIGRMAAMAAQMEKGRQS
ncbi:hypothetical protein [Hydrogenophaga sp. 5NK40-0174]|uniref:hypothetical protein n=1 Tax=Hydrogenophaga sp. 5NK40-0174 TaxID=3127649 RepID=UPI0031071655